MASKMAMTFCYEQERQSIGNLYSHDNSSITGHQIWREILAQSLRDLRPEPSSEGGLLRVEFLPSTSPFKSPNIAAAREPSEPLLPLFGRGLSSVEFAGRDVVLNGLPGIPFNFHVPEPTAE